jgi:hypothetical protein
VLEDRDAHIRSNLSLTLCKVDEGLILHTSREANWIFETHLPGSIVEGAIDWPSVRQGEAILDRIVDVEASRALVRAGCLNVPVRRGGEVNRSCRADCLGDRRMERGERNYSPCTAVFHDRLGAETRGESVGEADVGGGKKVLAVAQLPRREFLIAETPARDHSGFCPWRSDAEINGTPERLPVDRNFGEGTDFVGKKSVD